MHDKLQHKGLALLVLAGAQFMVVLDATIVNVALPSIEKALHFSNSAQLQWIVTAYTLLFGGFLLLGGRLADLFGRRRLFLLGVALFAASSLLAGLAQNPGMLIAFRSIQGLGAALLSPAALSLILNIFPEGKERNRALGVWSGVAAGGGAVGLLLGGILTQYVGWRWIFFINIPIGMLVVFLAPRFVPTSERAVGKQKIDYSGAFAVTAGLMTLVYALVKATDYGWTSSKTIGLISAAVVLLIGFVVNEALVKKPLIPLTIFKNRNLSAANLMQLPMTAAMFSVFFYLSLYEQQILGFSPVKTGLANLPFTLVIGIVAGIVSRVIIKTGAKKILIVAPLFVAAGLLYFSHIPVHGTYVANLLPGIILMATGIAGSFVALTLAATSGVPHKDAGLASGLLNTSQQIGGALGLAILTAISTSKTKSILATKGGDPAAVPSALVQGFHTAFMVAVGFSLVACVIAVFGLLNTKMTPEEIANEEATEAEGFPVVPGI
jgi:EmrB/QacA subfamily drug resistance transporter